MIDFKNKDELPTTVVTLGSFGVMAIAAGCILFLPKPIPPTVHANAAKRNKVIDMTEAVTKKTNSVNLELAKYMWAGTPEDVGPVALQEVNGLLEHRSLKLVGFHTQKPIADPNVTEVPFIISVDGPFPAVMAFAKELEKPGSKLVVNIFQVSNADQSTDKVTASIGITAYQMPLPAATATSTSTTTTTTTTTKSSSKTTPAKTPAPAPVKRAATVVKKNA